MEHAILLWGNFEMITQHLVSLMVSGGGAIWLWASIKNFKESLDSKDWPFVMGKFLSRENYNYDSHQTTLGPKGSVLTWKKSYHLDIYIYEVAGKQYRYIFRSKKSVPESEISLFYNPHQPDEVIRHQGVCKSQVLEILLSGALVLFGFFCL